jgi:hypothetical protein
MATPLALYVIAVGVIQTGLEIHAGMMLRHPLMSMSEFVTSFFCSHVMMPALNVFAALGVVRDPLSRSCC